MVCLKTNGTKMTAKEAMAAGCPFVIDTKLEPYGNSKVHVSRNGTRRNRKNRKASRKNRRNTRRNRK